MTKKTKKYTLTAQDIQAYLCELGIKPTKEVSIYSIEYYFDKQTVSADKLSVEKLQEHLLPYSKEMVQKIRDEKMQLVTADEFVKLHKESLTAIRENDKLQEQLNTAKKALTEIDNGTWHSRDRGLVVDISDGETVSLFALTEQALAAIGGDDE